jgi:immune inhibitor A
MWWVAVSASCAMLLLFPAASGWAVDLHPLTKQQLIEQGSWEIHKQRIQAARAAGMDTPQIRPAHKLAAGVQTEQFASRIPCILVEFSDNLWASRVYTSPALIESMIYSAGEFATGSMREYYQENSYGLFNITGEVVGPLLMPDTYAYYVGADHGISTIEPNSQTLARDALLAANSYIDFSDYDVDGDGEVDGVMVIFAGFGYEEAADEESQTIQSHQWTLSDNPPVILDGKMVREYTVQPEEHGPVVGTATNGIGVWCHEWGHIIGLPDLYDQDFSSWGVGYWSIMGSGNYLNQSRTPAHFDPWCKSFLGWVNVVNVQTNLVDQAIPAYAESPTIYRLWMAGITGNEYFLVCNRQRTGFDSQLPDDGLMLLHCDENKSNNTNEYIPGVGIPSQHYKVAVVQADGDYDLERYDAGNPGDGTDLYDNNSQEFDDLTTPGSRAYGEALSTQVAVWNISPSGPAMTANLDVTYSRPLLVCSSHVFNDESGDGDDIPDPGETVEMIITTYNFWKPTTNIEVMVSCSTPEVIFTRDSYTISQLGTKSYDQNNAGNEILLTVAAGMQPTISDFYITYSCEDGAFTFAETLSVDLGPKQVLIVDDDAQYSGKDYAHYYADALTTLRIPHEGYDKDLSGSPSPGLLTGYPMVCWYTGLDRPDSMLVHDDVAALQQYLDAGGRLFLTGQDIAEKLSKTADSLFLVNYLGARYAGGSTVEPPFVRGIAGDPIGDGISLVLGGSGTAANQHSPDNLEPVAGASVSFIYDTLYSSGKIAGVTYAHAGFKTVFWAFGFEAVNSTYPQYGLSRTEILADILYWLVGLSTGILEDEESFAGDAAENNIPARFTLAQNYPNPFNGRTIIEFTVGVGGPEEISLDVFDILGRRVITLFKGLSEPGIHRVEWDGRDYRGIAVASGVYFYRLAERNGETVSRRMVYLK